MIAFAFFIVTAIMTLALWTCEYWKLCLNLLLMKHFIDFVGFTLELTGFSIRDMKLAGYKLIGDVFSCVIAIFVQVLFVKSYSTEVEE